jgi:ATP-binding cassette subfamily C protein LapB
MALMPARSMCTTAPYIGYAPQDIHLFSGTLRENLLTVPATLTMRPCCGLQPDRVHEFARRHPSGYNMQVGERG